jgi:hypothetical protein
MGSIITQILLVGQAPIIGCIITQLLLAGQVPIMGSIIVQVVSPGHVFIMLLHSLLWHCPILCSIL